MALRDHGLGASSSWWTLAPFALSVLGCGGKSGDVRCDPGAVCDSSATGGQGGSSTSSTTGGGKGGSLGTGGAPAVDAGRAFQKRIVAYLPTWSGSLNALALDLPWLEVSQINVAFAYPAGSTLTLATPPAMPGTGQDPYIADFVKAAHAKGATVFVSLGGAGGSAAIAAQLVPASVDAFVTSIVSYVDAQNLDGIDVDVEGNNVNANYGPFVNKLVQQLHPKGKQVTAALAQWFGNRVDNATYALFDSVNVMSYDHCNNNTPGQCATYDSAVSELTYFQSKGLSTDKILLGVPFYCHCWGTGCGGMAQISYAQVNLKFPGGMDDIVSAGTTYSCNGPATIQRKAALAQDYAGMMAWEITQDAGGDQSLLKVMADHL